MKRNPTQDYVVAWRWKRYSSHTHMDEIQATNVTRAVNKLIKNLSAEYADVRRNIVIEEVRLGKLP